MIILNGRQILINIEDNLTLTELITCIRDTYVDPDHMLTSVLLDGNELFESDWQSSFSHIKNRKLELESDFINNYINQKLTQAPSVINTCFMLFRDTRKTFQGGLTTDGNKRLIDAVNTLKAFFEWYSTINQLISEELRVKFSIEENVQEISKICEKICTMQLHQSWWAMGEIIQQNLEPELDKLDNKLRRFAIEFPKQPIANNLSSLNV